MIILEKNTSDPSHTILCMRLNKVWRDNVLNGSASLKQAFRALSHPVRQNRFLQDREKLFDIDIMEDETAIQKIDSVPQMDLSHYFISGRGVEISKHGKVAICEKCGNANPIPRKYSHINCKCGHIFDMSDNVVECIITKKKTKNSVPLLVGEDILRYNCKPKRYLKKDVRGIQYKNQEVFRQKKLLVRKTGIGIKAAIDNSGAYTNQVIFHYIAKQEKGIPDFITEYVQGVLSSRVLLAYYLQRYGENEWRSHPYITQKIISQLPIPDIVNNGKSFKLAHEISQLVGQMSCASEREKNMIDIKIEKKVVKLFGLSAEECKWVIQTLKNSQQLEPIRSVVLEDYKLLVD